MTSDVQQAERHIADLRAHMDEGSLAKYWAVGRAMPLQQAVDYALTAPDLSG